eukprot:TRINITY_DN2145_c0_g1_i1.p1 TRINITY_DN2145_c0_g1~~TRINITY_DN2145_c0_g1_i1.p1  ORF type:complete len:227 (-),score=37.69 TRINITY_DN2145_c0_g1_i1:89-769(-)
MGHVHSRGYRRWVTLHHKSSVLGVNFAKKPLDLKSAFLRSSGGEDNKDAPSLIGWMNYGSLFDVWVDPKLLVALTEVGLYIHRAEDSKPKNAIAEPADGKHKRSVSFSQNSREEVTSKVEHASMIIDAIDRHPAGSTPLILSLLWIFSRSPCVITCFGEAKEVVLDFVLPLLVSGNDEYQKAALEMVQLIVKTDQSVLTPIVKHVMDLCQVDDGMNRSRYRRRKLR